MPKTVLSPLLMFALLAVLSTGLASCGRKGDLEAPSAVPLTEEDKAQPAKPVVEDNKFLLDPLL